MRVSELANELGKTSKEILEIIKTKDKSAVLYAASNVTKDQENIVRSFANPKRDARSRSCRIHYVLSRMRNKIDTDRR